jgi:adenylate cyclase
MEFTVLGDAVNVASRLEQATKRYGEMILASGAAVEGSSDRAAWREIGLEALAGRKEPVAIYAPTASPSTSGDSDISSAQLGSQKPV